MAAVPPNSATISVPRARFFFASLFVASSTIYALSRIISGINLIALYRTAMFSAIFTELLTLKMFIPILNSFSPQVLQSLLSSPSFAHFSLAIFLWLNSSTFLVQTISMIIINTFLILEYAPTDSNIVNSSYWKVHLKPFADKVIPRKPNLLYFAAHLEILNLLLVIISIIRMKGNFLQLFIFTEYLIVQYISSPVMQQAIRFWDAILSKLLTDPRCPPIIKVANQTAREYLKKLVDFTSQFVQVNNVQHKPKNR